MKPKQASFGYPEVNLCSKEQCERQQRNMNSCINSYFAIVVHIVLSCINLLPGTQRLLVPASFWEYRCSIQSTMRSVLLYDKLASYVSRDVFKTGLILSGINGQSGLPQFICILLSLRAQNREINRSPTRVGSFEVCVLAHIALRMLSAITLASQWHFLANKHAVLAGCSAFWPGHVAPPEWDFCTGCPKKPQNYWNHLLLEFECYSTKLNPRV